MVTQVTIHFEGDANLRPGFRALLKSHAKRARQKRIRFKLISGGSNVETVKDFIRSCRLRPSDLNILLIDSEEPVPDTADFIRKLRSRYLRDANAACDDGQLNFMVQAMESWFIADPKALIERFGRRFDASRLPNPQNAESISPAQLTDSIKRGLRSSGASAQSGAKRRYDKVSDGAKLLELVDESRVSRNCAHFRRLRDFLSQSV